MNMYVYVVLYEYTPPMEGVCMLNQKPHHATDRRRYHSSLGSTPQNAKLDA